MSGLSSRPSTSATTGGSNMISVAVTNNEEEVNPPPLGVRREVTNAQEQADCRGQYCAESATAAETKSNAPSERDLPRGVYKTRRGKFRSVINWGGKTRSIGTFDTPEQASAAFRSVETDLAQAKLSAVGADEVNAAFDAAKTKAVEAVGGTRNKELPQGAYKLPNEKFRSKIYWNGKERYIGLFDTPEEASAAYLSVKTDLANTNLSAVGADEVDAAFDAAKKKALEAAGKSVSEKRDLPTGVYKTSSGKFQALISWAGKTRSIGTFDTPEQASAAHMSVKKDCVHGNLSVLSSDEVDATFDAAKKKAVEAVGGSISKKKKTKAKSDDGERKTKRRRKLAELVSAARTGVSEQQGGLKRAAVGHGEKTGKSGAGHQAISERDLSAIYDPEVDGVLV